MKGPVSLLIMWWARVLPKLRACAFISRSKDPTLIYMGLLFLPAAVMAPSLGVRALIFRVGSVLGFMQVCGNGVVLSGDEMLWLGEPGSRDS